VVRRLPPQGGDPWARPPRRTGLQSRRSWPRAWDRRCWPGARAADPPPRRFAWRGSSKRSCPRASPRPRCDARPDRGRARGCGSGRRRTQRPPGVAGFPARGRGVLAPRVGVASLGQLPTPVRDHPLNRLGRDRGADRFVPHEGGAPEGPGLGRRPDHPVNQHRRQLPRVEAQGLPQGGKTPADSVGKRRAVRPAGPARRSRRPSVRRDAPDRRSHTRGMRPLAPAARPWSPDAAAGSCG